MRRILAIFELQKDSAESHINEEDPITNAVPNLVIEKYSPAEVQLGTTEILEDVGTD